MLSSTTDFYYDMSSLDRMRAKARKDPKQALETVAKQFESIFVKMMLDSMRDATFGDPLMESDNSKFYRDMYDEQLASDISAKGSIGLADMMVKQLSAQLPRENAEGIDKLVKSALTVAPVPAPSSTPTLAPTHTLPFAGAKKAISAYRQHSAVDAAHPAQGQSKRVFLDRTAEASNSNLDASSPESFIKSIWPHAKKAAEKLGVDAEVLVAQSALETGWGKHVIKHDNGNSSYNLFNIKADNRWDGNRVQKDTSEFKYGKKVQEQAQFRAYYDLKQSFDDYVSFIGNSPRYENALKHADDASRYVSELQKAGYATDPQYAGKVNNILNRDSVKQTFARLRLADSGQVASLNRQSIE